MHKNTTLLQLSLSANTKKMNPFSETKFEPKPSDVYAHGHLPLSHPGARVCEGHRGNGTRRGRGDRGGNGDAAGSGSGDGAAREGIRTASGTASGKASRTTRTTASSDAVWDWFYTRICQASDWELSYTDPFAGSVVRIRNPRDVLFEKMNLPSSLSDSGMRYMNSVYETEVRLGTQGLGCNFVILIIKLMPKELI